MALIEVVIYEVNEYIVFDKLYVRRLFNNNNNNNNTFLHNLLNFSTLGNRVPRAINKTKNNNINNNIIFFF